MARAVSRPGRRKRPPNVVAGSAESRTASVDPFALVGLGAALAQCDHEEDIARLAATAMTSALGVPFGAVVLHGEGEPKERTFGQFGDEPLDATVAREIEDFVVTSLGDAHGVSAQPTNEIDVKEEALPIATDVGLRRLLMVRLGTMDTSFGAVIAGKRSAEPSPPEARAILETLAGQASMALHRIHLNERMARRTKELSALNAIASAVSRTMDPSELLELALEQVIELTGMEGGAALLLDEETQRLMFAAERNFPQLAVDSMKRKPLPLGHFIPGLVAQRCELFYSDAVRDDEREVPALRQFGVMTHVCIPLAARGRGLGVFGIVDRRSVSLSPNDLALFTAIGEQLGIAIERAQLFDRQAKLNKQLEAANRHKSEFLAHLSHELRTPLNAILGGSELLAEGLFGELNEKQTEYIRDIHEGGSHLLSLINDVLDLSKVEAGKLDLRLSQFALRTLMESSAVIVRERAASKSLELNVSLPEEDVLLDADERKVKQIVYNLLSNAVKFTPENGRVAFSAQRNGDEMIFAVEDNGPGVPEELRERIFEEFFQAPGSEEGTGLGLALCRQLVELHGGRIWLESEVGQGSRFLFAIPVAREAAADSDNPSAAQ